MLEWFLNTIGYNDREVLAHLDRVTLSFQRPGVFWLGMALLPLIGWWVWTRQARNLGPVSKGLLAALTGTRLAIAGLLAATLASPILKLDHRVERRPLLAVLVDHSASMRLPAGPFENDTQLVSLARGAGLGTPEGELSATDREQFAGWSRLDLARQTLQHAGRTLWPQLAEKYELRFYGFADTLQPFPVDPANAEWPAVDEAAAGAVGTHLGTAVGQVLEEAGGRPLAGVLVLSDGQTTGGSSVAETAKEAAAAKAPVFATPVGSQVRLRDVAVVDSFTSGQVAVGDKAIVSVTLESTGFDGRGVEVRLLDGQTLLASRRLVLAGAEQQTVELSFEAKEPGLRTLTVEIPPQAEEPAPLHANNTDIVSLRVNAEKVKVLVIEGGPRWDFRFLKNAMRRDNGLAGREAEQPDVLLDSELARKGATATTEAYPATLDELAEYHTIVLGDIPPERLPSGFFELLRQAVSERGVGLIVAAGPRATPHAYGNELREMLPVQLLGGLLLGGQAAEGQAATGRAGLSAPVYNPYRLEVTSEGELNEMMRLDEEAGANREAWARMPAYYWCAAAQRPSPAATVLAVNPHVENGYGKLPLIAWQYFGTGRVLFIGTDSTWLWRQNSGDRYYYTFWGQALRFVGRGDPDDKQKSRLELHPNRVQPGEATRVELHAFDADGKPVEGRTHFVVVAVPDGQTATVEVTADTRQPGRFVGRFVPRVAGDYLAGWEGETGGERVTARMKVLASSAELRHPNVNRQALEGLATTSGGQLLDLPQIAGLADRLKAEPSVTHLDREKTLWDNWLLLVLLASLYSLDVALRRLTGLT